MNFTELFSNPSMMHAAIVHMPIAAVVFGLILIILSAIFHRNNTIRSVTALFFLIAAVSAYVAIETGETARDLVPNTISKEISDQLTAHSRYAENVLYASIFTLVFLLVSLIRVDTVRIIGLILAGIGALAANVFVAQTGHLGGSLVYNHGVGTPFIHEPAPTPAPVVPEPPAEVPAPVEVAPEVPVETPMPPDTPAEAPMPAEAPVETPEPVDNPDWVAIKDFTMEEAKLISYKNDIWPIIDDQCIVCHEDDDADGDFRMSSVAEMLVGGKKGGPGIVPGKPDESSIVKYIRGIVNPRMPEDEPPLPEEMLHKIRMWIAAGAIDDTAAAPAEEAPAPETAPAEVTEEAAPALTEEMKESAADTETATEASADVATESPAEEMKPAEAATTETVEETAATATDTATTKAADTTEESAPAEEMKEAPATEEATATESDTTSEAPAASTATESAETTTTEETSEAPAATEEAPAAEESSETTTEETPAADAPEA